MHSLISSAETPPALQAAIAGIGGTGGVAAAAVAEAIAAGGIGNVAVDVDILNVLRGAQSARNTSDVSCRSHSPSVEPIRNNLSPSSSCNSKHSGLSGSLPEFVEDEVDDVDVNLMCFITKSAIRTSKGVDRISFLSYLQVNLALAFPS